MLRKLKNLLQAEIDPSFSARAESIFETVEEKIPKIILDAGCGRGFYVQALSFYAFPTEIHGIDLNAKYVAKARKTCLDKRVKIKKGSLYALPYPDNYFDFIICSEILEHLEDDSAGLLELKRVLKKTGTLIVTVPHHNFPFFWDPLNWILMHLFNTHTPKDMWWLSGVWADHVRLYTEEELSSLVKQAGFNVKKVKRLIRYCLPFTHFIIYGIGKNMVERLGMKEFDRFNFQEKKLSRVLASIFAFPRKFEMPITKDQPYFTLVFTLSKV